MEKEQFKIGAKVYHKSDSSVIWIIERIEEDEAFCSTLSKDTKELKKEKFALVTLEIYESPTIRFGKLESRNRY